MGDPINRKFEVNAQKGELDPKRPRTLKNTSASPTDGEGVTKEAWDQFSKKIEELSTERFSTKSGPRQQAILFFQNLARSAAAHFKLSDFLPGGCSDDELVDKYREHGLHLGAIPSLRSLAESLTKR